MADSARERIARIAPVFDEQDAGLAAPDPIGFPGYREQLERARADSAASEACVWGWADIGGVRCALVVGDFSFLGGSMGVAVGEKVARAFDAARRDGTPVVTVTASGGARMQEGMASLVQMAATVQARREHADAGLAHVSVLTSPTTGGVYASFASLADVILAEPEATIGFAGPRVVAELAGTTPAPHVHTAEFAHEHGLVDALVSEAELPAVLGRILSVLGPAPQGPSGRVGLGGRSAPDQLGARGSGQVSAWERLELARDPKRPKAPFLLDAILASSFPLSGDRSGLPDDAHVDVRVGTLSAADLNVVAVGQDASGDGRIRPQGFRKAVRAIELAGRLGLPVLTLIDTRGADPLPSSEGHGIASAIARTFDAMLACPTPTLAVVTGEGGSGGALAMAVADRVLAWEHAVFSVIAPEGAAAILYRDVERAPELAGQLKITAADLLELGIIDEVIPEPGAGVQAAPREGAEELAGVVARELAELAGRRGKPRLRRRQRRWRSLMTAHLRPIS